MARTSRFAVARQDLTELLAEGISNRLLALPPFLPKHGHICPAVYFCGRSAAASRLRQLSVRQASVPGDTAGRLCFLQYVQYLRIRVPTGASYTLGGTQVTAVY